VVLHFKLASDSAAVHVTSTEYGAGVLGTYMLASIPLVIFQLDVGVGMVFGR
jgi:hypothetical protein